MPKLKPAAKHGKERGTRAIQVGGCSRMTLNGHLARSKRGREGHSVEGPVPQETVTPDPLELAFSLLCWSWSGGGSVTSGWEPDGAITPYTVIGIAWVQAHATHWF